MPRPDLVALTDDGLVQLSNAGLVKRGLKDLAAGSGPELVEQDDGVVSATFSDGTLTRLSPEKSLTDATCTCPASGMCRHRVMLALSYRDRFSADAPPSAEGWDPAAIDGEAFEASLPAGAKSELTRLLAARIDVRLDRGAVPAARLPMATVRFLAPNDLDYARCDCAAGLRCAHVAMALRAFKASDGAQEVSLGRTEAAAEPAGGAGLDEAIDVALAHLLDVGLVAGAAAHAQTLGHARRLSEAAGAVQLTLTIDALAEQIEAYEARSARHDELAALGLATELYARPRAGDRAMALGLGEPFETAMSKTRLVSLGARLRAEGDDIRAGVLFADSDTGAIMLAEKLFSPAPSEAGRLAETVSRRQLAPGLAVMNAGRGQILTSVGRRRADGLLALGSGAAGKTALTPRDAVFNFMVPLMAADAVALVERFSNRPPAFLRPRRKIDDVHVFEVEEVLGQSWEPGAQLWQATIRLRDGGGVLYLERAYDAAAPGALDVLSAVFDGRHGPVRQASGPVRIDGGALVLDPWSIGADRFVVPDLDLSNPDGAPDLIGGGGPTSPVDDALRALAGAVHAGRRASSAAARIARELEDRGFQTAANRIVAWSDSGQSEVTAFGQAAIWLAGLREEAH